MISHLYCLLLLWPCPSHVPSLLQCLNFFICKVGIMNVLLALRQIQILSKLTEVSDMDSFNGAL